MLIRFPETRRGSEAGKQSIHLLLYGLALGVGLIAVASVFSESSSSVSLDSPKGEVLLLSLIHI